jgi:hypothetical protein
MYFNVFGGSTLLHLLAGHPRLVAAFGVVGSVALLASSVSHGHYLGAAPYAQKLDQVIVEHSVVDQGTITKATRMANKLGRQSPRVVNRAVRRTLASCGGHCAELTPAMVERNKKLLKTALFVYELDWASRRSRLALSASEVRAEARHQ